jgi:4-carboxymuconolactone decarboxylase
MRRIEPVKPNEMNDLQKRIVREIANGPRKNVGELMLLWLHSPVLADLAQKVGAYFRDGTSLPQPIMEMIVLIVARRWNSEYEWVAHEPLARSKGLDPEIIEAIRNCAVPAFADPAAKAAYDFTTEMLDTHQVSDEVFDRVLATLGKNGFIDMSILIGHYVHGAVVLNGVRQPRPASASAPFPAS